MTIYELKRRNIANGGHFFGRNTMKIFGDTLKGFGVRQGPDSESVIVTRKRTGRSWQFDKKSGRMEFPVGA